MVFNLGDNNLLHECVLFEHDRKGLYEEFRKRLKGQNEEHLDYIRNEERSISKTS